MLGYRVRFCTESDTFTRVFGSREEFMETVSECVGLGQVFLDMQDYKGRPVFVDFSKIWKIDLPPEGTECGDERE